MMKNENVHKITMEQTRECLVMTSCFTDSNLKLN